MSASTFYFSSSRDFEGSADVDRGISLALTSHFGSIALASGIQTLIAILRFLADYLDNESDNAVAKIAQCCVYCIGDKLEWLNSTALSYQVLSGEPYCKSAWNGFLLNFKYLVRFFIAKSISGWFVFLGFFFILAINSGLCFLILYLSNV